MSFLAKLNGDIKDSISNALRPLFINETEGFSADFLALLDSYSQMDPPIVSPAEFELMRAATSILNDTVKPLGDAVTDRDIADAAPTMRMLGAIHEQMYNKLSGLIANGSIEHNESLAYLHVAHNALKQFNDIYTQASQSPGTPFGIR